MEHEKYYRTAYACTDCGHLGTLILPESSSISDWQCLYCDSLLVSEICTVRSDVKEIEDEDQTDS